MNLARQVFDLTYDVIKYPIFWATKPNPEIAHTLFAKSCRLLYKTGLENFVLDNDSNRKDPGFEISNAAGFNKDAEIPPSVIKYLGFNRCVIGTVTHDYHEGNPGRPRVWRYLKSKTFVNCLGLPGHGSKAVAEKLRTYGNHQVPLTINIMATPGKTGKAVLDDLEGTVKHLRGIIYVNRFELNISCPNTEHNIQDYQNQLEDMLKVMEDNMWGQELYVKVSPDLTEEAIQETLSVIRDNKIVTGITTTNTTTRHNPIYISNSPGKGGGSGDAVWDYSVETQNRFSEAMDKANMNLKIIACGGISSPERAKQRIEMDKERVKGTQYFTPIVFVGPKLLRILRNS